MVQNIHQRFEMKAFENGNIGIRGVIEILKNKEYDIEFVRIPLFEISAKEFLNFAKSDFKPVNRRF